MHIVMIAPECAPVAKVGGLADVVSSLSKSLQSQGHRVEVILPKYDSMRYDKISDLKTEYQELVVPHAGQEHANSVWRGTVEEVPCYFIDTNWHKNYFNRGDIYGEADDTERFAYFSRAALEFIFRTRKEVDIIHCHDWATGLVPMLFYEIYRPMGLKKPRLFYSIHNFEHQGIAPESVLFNIGLQPEQISRESREHGQWGAVNMMKTAILYTDYANTVSPTYAREVMFTDKGAGLQHLLQSHSHKFTGILNGLDCDYWNPQTDPEIPHHYSATDLLPKYKNKLALRQKLWLRDEFTPVVAVVSRLVWQKGVELIKHAIRYTLSRGAQFVLLGSSPDARITADFENIKRQLNDHPDCHLELGFDEELSHLIYAGSDIFIVPSMFEPCGLTQMIAMRYGAVPVVRSTGGLADTVFDSMHSNRPWEQRNGYVFESTDGPGLESALGRAIDCWFEHPQVFRELIEHGMRQDFSWKQSSSAYVALYEELHNS